jgi:hypothetical protein
MMEQFLEELVQTFPDEIGIQKFRTSFDVLRKANARMCMKNYMESITPYAQYIMSRDEAFFLEHTSDIEFLKDLNLKRIWSSDLSINTKGAIWQYLQTLYIIGGTISALPDETLSIIEQMAQKCASEMDPNSFDPSALMGMLTGALGAEKKS